MQKKSEVALRAIEPNDLEFLYQAENDQALWHVGVVHQPLSKHTLKAYLENAHQTIEEAGQLRLAIETGTDGLVGMIDVFDYDATNQRAGVGIMVLEQFQQKGYATAAVQLLKEYCKTQLLLHQLHCQIQSTNAKSISLFEKCGFNTTGTLHQWQRTINGFEDVHVLQCIL